jgi:hypothetical protein
MGGEYGMITANTVILTKGEKRIQVTKNMPDTRTLKVNKMWYVEGKPKPVNFGWWRKEKKEKAWNEDPRNYSFGLNMNFGIQMHVRVREYFPPLTAEDVQDSPNTKSWKIFWSKDEIFAESEVQGLYKSWYVDRYLRREKTYFRADLDIVKTLLRNDFMYLRAEMPIDYLIKPGQKNVCSRSNGEYAVFATRENFREQFREFLECESYYQGVIKSYLDQGWAIISDIP